MKKLITITTLALGVLAVILSLKVKVVSAQEEPEVVAAKYGVTFPIADLGNCGTYSECRTFCEDPINSTACIAFAKSKGFYKEEESKADETIVSRAKAALGCDSKDSCKALCEKSENFEKCHSFAQSNGLAGGYREDPTKGKILEKAKEVLGCNSYEGCKSFCDNPTNQDKCSQFAAQAGVRGGYEYKGPGGCTSTETCKDFCSIPENVEMCRSYAQGTGTRFSGPGGCTDEASCRSYCEKNPSACNVSNEVIRKDYNPESMCWRTPTCKWESNSCQCGSTSNEQVGNYDPKAQCQKYPGCSWNGSWCQCQSNEAELERQKTQCVSYSGCTWTGTNCQCGSYGGSGGTGSYTGGRMSREQQESMCRSGGGTCSWENDICNCQGYKAPTDTSRTYTPFPNTSGSGSGSYYTPYPGSYSGSSGSYSGSYSSGSTMTTEQQESMCRSGGGTCDWSSGICNCKGYTSSGTTTTTTQNTPVPQQNTYDPATECAKTSGCSWNGSSCQCSGSSEQTSTQSQPAPDPASACSSTPGCSWNGSSCQCGTVQGIATVYIKTWWQTLFDNLLQKKD